jgi:hypothetical protein
MSASAPSARATTMGQITDIHFERGEYDEALRILCEMLPIYERLGDIRSRVVTMGRIADIHHQRSEYDEALRIRREEELPVQERLGDVRGRSVTLQKIANALIESAVSHRAAFSKSMKRWPKLLRLPNNFRCRMGSLASAGTSRQILRSTGCSTKHSPSLPMPKSHSPNSAIRLGSRQSPSCAGQSNNARTPGNSVTESRRSAR